MASPKATFNKSTNTIKLAPVDNIVYTIGGKPVEGEVQITKPTTVRVSAARGFILDKAHTRSYSFAPNEGKIEDVEVADPAKPADPIQTDAGGPPEVPTPNSGRPRP